jgi:hypothetical protein
MPHEDPPPGSEYLHNEERERERVWGHGGNLQVVVVCRVIIMIEFDKIRVKTHTHTRFSVNLIPLLRGFEILAIDDAYP